MRDKRYHYGLTLIEVLLAVVLIGLAIASLVVSSGTFTRANAAGTYLSTAEFLLEQIRELTVPLPVVDPETENAIFGPEADEATLADYDDLDDFDDAVFSPPINAERATLNGFAAFTQQVTVQNVSAGNFDQVLADHGSFFVRVTVKILMNSEEIASASWVRSWYEEP